MFYLVEEFALERYLHLSCCFNLLRRLLTTRKYFLYVLVLLFICANNTLDAADAGLDSKPTWLPQILGAQATFIYQNAPSFHSPYLGEKSFIFDHTFKQQMTQTYGLYLGSQVTKSLQLCADFEMFRGSGISDGLGLGGYSNGDVIRAGPANLGPDPYLGRLYARYVIPLSAEMSEPLPRAMGQMPVAQPVDRIEIKAGKLAPTDDLTRTAMQITSGLSSSTTRSCSIRPGITPQTQGVTPWVRLSPSSIPPGN